MTSCSGASTCTARFVSDEMPFVKMMLAAESLGIADGATELRTR